MRRFDLEQYLIQAEKFRVTVLTVVPPIAIAMIKSPLTQRQRYFGSVKDGIVGAAPLDKRSQGSFQALVGEGAPFNQVWELTETAYFATMFTYPEQDDTGSVGRLIPNLEAKLIGDDGKNISAYGVRGELCVRSPTIIPGYFENPTAKKES